MNVAVVICFCLFFGKHIFFVVILCGFASVLKHRAHRGIAVDVRIVALEIAFSAVSVRQFIERAHKLTIHFARIRAVSTECGVFSERVIKTAVFERSLYGLLYLNSRHFRRTFKIARNRRTKIRLHNIRNLF